MQRKALPIVILLVIFVGAGAFWYFSPQQRLNRKINHLVVALVKDEDGDGVEAGAELIEIGKPAVPALLEALKSTTDNPCLFDWVTGMLVNIGDPSIVPALREFLKHKDYEIRSCVASALCTFGDTTTGFSVYMEGLSNEDPGNRSSSATALGIIGDKRAVLPLIERLRTDEDSYVRERSAWALGQIGDKKAVAPLIEALEDRKGRVFAYAIGALNRITGQSFGFSSDAPEEEQEKAIKKWQEWWEQTKTNFPI